MWEEGIDLVRKRGNEVCYFLAPPPLPPSPYPLFFFSSMLVLCKDLEHIELFHTLVQTMAAAGTLHRHCDRALALMPSAYGVLELLALLRGEEDPQVALSPSLPSTCCLPCPCIPLTDQSPSLAKSPVAGGLVLAADARGPLTIGSIRPHLVRMLRARGVKKAAS